MGTRGFVGFVVDGVEKIAYNHWDSYPDGLGVDVLEFITAARRERPEWLLDRARALRVIKDGEKPTAADIEALAPFTDTDVGEQSTDDWYCLLRGTQGDPEKILQAGYVEDGSSFPLDSLMCEWGYLIDLDALGFEVYKGFQTAPHRWGRFAPREVTDEYARKNGYQPVAEVRVWSLTDLPDRDTFLAELELKDEDED